MKGFITTIELKVTTNANFKKQTIKQSFTGFDYTQESSLKQAERHAEEYLNNKYVLDYKIDDIRIESV